MAPAPQSPLGTVPRTALPLAYSPASAERCAQVCIVAEIGVNHDGNAEKAGTLIAAASQAGADAVKLQYFHPDRLLSNQAELAGYQQGQAASQHALLSRLALPRDTLVALGEQAHDAGLGFVVTPFSPDDADELAGVPLSAVKTASPDAVNPPLLERVFALGVPVLLSTGTCTLDELADAAQRMRAHAAGGVMLHCVSSYPTPPKDAGLHGMSAIASRFGLPVGYSDHTPLTLTGALATAAGAVVLEKHLTFDCGASGPDHAASLDPAGLAEYIRQVRAAERMLGPIAKSTGDVETDVRRVSRQSVCALRDLPAGHRLMRSDLTVKRPGTGIPAAQLGTLVGQTLIRTVGKNDLIHSDDVG